MHICHVITRLIIGGAQENTLLTCEGLVRRGHEVTLVAGPDAGAEGSLWPWAQECCTRVVRIASLRRNIHPLDDLRCVGDLARCFRELAPQVVHTHSSKAGILGRRAAVRAGVPGVIHTIHGMSFNRTQRWPVQMLYRLLERHAARHTHALVSVADAMTEQAVAAGIAPREKFTTIYSGMRTEWFRPDPEVRRQVRAEWGVSPQDVVVGTVARLFKNKGYDELAPAVARVLKKAPQCFFVWVGGGPQRQRYEMILEGSGVRDRVRFIGLVAPAGIPPLLSGFDLLVHTSRWEGLPRVAVQALLTEVPVVAYPIDGTPEVVIPDKTGLLVKAFDFEALADGIVELVNAPNRRQNMGRYGRTLCLNRFDHEAMVAKLETLYEKVVAGRDQGTEGSRDRGIEGPRG